MAPIAPAGVSVAELTRAHQAAAAERGEYLQSMLDGFVSLGATVVAASDSAKSPLRTMRLTTAVEAELSDAGKRRRKAARRAIDLMLESLELTGKERPAALTIGWLLAERAGQRRLIAFAEAVVRVSTEDRKTPWAGFPLAEGKVQL